MTQQDIDWWRQQSVPYAKGSETSKAAADSVRSDLGRREKQVLAVFRKAGARGLTTDEAEQITGLPHQSCSARVNGLTEKGLLKLTDQRRATRSKRMAGVYVLA